MSTEWQTAESSAVRTAGRPIGENRGNSDESGRSLRFKERRDVCRSCGSFFEPVPPPALRNLAGFPQKLWRPTACSAELCSLVKKQVKRPSSCQQVTIDSPSQDSSVTAALSSCAINNGALGMHGNVTLLSCSRRDSAQLQLH